MCQGWSPNIEVGCKNFATPRLTRKRRQSASQSMVAVPKQNTHNLVPSRTAMKPPTNNMRFLTAPLKFVWGMAMWAVFLLLSPLRFLGVLVFGIHRMSADDIGVMKVLLVVLGPFAFVFWFILISHFGGRFRAKRLIAERSQTGDEYTEADLRFLEHVGKPHHLRTFGVLLLSLAGSVYCAHLFYNSGDQLFFLGVLAGIFSPAIIVAVYRLLRRFMSESA